jgi:hypothetical protein
MKSSIGIAVCILRAAIAGGQDTGQAADQAAGKTFERICGNCHDPSTAASEKHARRGHRGGLGVAGRDGNT